ncbi:PDDEXK family nuclease [Hymenobacter mucosus]|uniref:hypothetical protein n=1 Tax=Hymenobacter mucosus TaxID=1411120 RepID=UPI00117AB650|nr:hypothetical protein [Hymenobacter mucosus]
MSATPAPAPAAERSARRAEPARPTPPPATPRPAPQRPAAEQVPVPGEIKYIGYEPLPARSNSRYPYLRWPAAGNRVPVKFPRAGRSANRGYCEAAFVEHLRRFFPKSGPVRVLDNHHLPTANASRPYEPDVALLHERNGLNLFLNVEIDEPYDGANRLPTHCQGDDDSRDNFFTSRGWVVLRFAEIQVHQQPEACCAVIAHLIARLDPTYQIPEILLSVGTPAGVVVWDVVQAQKWAKARYREQYLGITDFGRYESSGVGPAAESLPIEAEIEKLVAQAAPLPPPPKPGTLQKANPDPRRSALSFDADAHQYYINGQPALAVSTLVSRFFPKFDTEYWSAYKAAQRGCAPEDVAQEWADKAAASSRAGTALHQQIEDFYNQGTPATGPEFAHFLSFHRAFSHLVPHRTEWQVYSEELMLAGTLDFVARNTDGTLSIYDWKRSHKVVDAAGQVQLNRYQTAEGPLGDLPDCSFSHYTMQQNMYKWLLETNYGCRVRDMHLVVLHPDYDRYHLIPVPERPAHVARMLDVVRAKR